MKYYASRKDSQPKPGPGHLSYSILDESNGCVAGFCVGISVYAANDYPEPGLHEDQEGFVVLEGTGWAQVGDQEHKYDCDKNGIRAHRSGPRFEARLPTGLHGRRLRRNYNSDLAGGPRKGRDRIGL